MGVIAPPTVEKDKKQSLDKGLLKTALFSKTREIITTADGSQMLVAQALADRLINIALFSESNTDSIAASKLIFERLYGKAALEKVEETKEMPKVIFALNETGLEKINEAAASSDGSKPESDPKILVKTDDGKEFLA